MNYQNHYHALDEQKKEIVGEANMKLIFLSSLNYLQQVYNIYRLKQHAP